MPFSFFFFFCHIQGMQKFLGQGLNLSRSSDNAQLLTTRPPGNSYAIFFKGLEHPWILDHGGSWNYSQWIGCSYNQSQWILRDDCINHIANH